MFRRLLGMKEPPSISLQIDVVIEEDEGRFHAFAPAFTGLHMDGATQQEAFKNLVKGMSVYIESLATHGEPLPIGPNLRVHEPARVPAGAFLRSVTIQWPSLQMSGTR